MIVDRTQALSQANQVLERELAERELAAAVFENAAEAIFITDEHGNFVEVNPAFVRMTGYAAAEVLGRPVTLLKPGRHSSEFYADMWHSVNQDNSWQGEVWNQRKSGEVFVVWLSTGRVARAGQPVHFVAILTDITRSKELEQELRHRAYHDPLTHLPNRTLFADRLRVAIPAPWVLVFMWEPACRRFCGGM